MTPTVHFRVGGIAPLVLVETGDGAVVDITRAVRQATIHIGVDAVVTATIEVYVGSLDIAGIKVESLIPIDKLPDNAGH